MPKFMAFEMKKGSISDAQLSLIQKQHMGRKEKKVPLPICKDSGSKSNRQGYDSAIHSPRH